MYYLVHRIIIMAFQLTERWFSLCFLLAYFGMAAYRFQ